MNWESNMNNLRMPSSRIQMLMRWWFILKVWRTGPWMVLSRGLHNVWISFLVVISYACTKRFAMSGLCDKSLPYECPKHSIRRLKPTQFQNATSQVPLIGCLIIANFRSWEQGYFEQQQRYKAYPFSQHS